MALAFITKVHFLHIAGYPLDNTMNQFVERTAGTGLTESVMLAYDPNNPALRPSDKQIDELIDSLFAWMTTLPASNEQFRNTVREWLTKIGC